MPTAAAQFKSEHNQIRPLLLQTRPLGVETGQYQRRRLAGAPSRYRLRQIDRPGLTRVEAEPFGGLANPADPPAFKHHPVVVLARLAGYDGGAKG